MHAASRAELEWRLILGFENVYFLHCHSCKNLLFNSLRNAFWPIPSDFTFPFWSYIILLQVTKSLLMFYFSIMSKLDAPEDHEFALEFTFDSGKCSHFCIFISWSPFWMYHWISASILMIPPFACCQQFIGIVLTCQQFMRPPSITDSY